MTETSPLLEQLRKTIQSKTNFPIGVLAYYGPDDKTITKIIGIVIPSKGIKPILKRWQGPEIATDHEAAAEIGQFFRTHKAQEVVMTDGIIGCPHEEGVDYPVGESCPQCPFWSGKNP